MPALSYSKPFAPKVWRNDKRQTIRAMRKRPIKVGDTLYHYYGMRRPGCVRLGISKAEEVLPIEIHAPLLTVPRRVIVDGNRVGPRTLHELACDDGFDSVDAFFDWFKPGNRSHAFRGQLIMWPTTWHAALDLDNIEDFEDAPHFLHSDACPSYCDYACNPKGFDQAKMIATLGIWKHVEDPS